MARAPDRYRRLSGAVVGIVVILTAACAEDKPEAETVRRDRGGAPPVVYIDKQAPVELEMFDPEKEPNNAPADAALLAAPGGVVGTLDGASDVNMFAVVPSADGVLSVRLSGIAGVDLVLELQDKGGKTLARSDRGPALTREGVPNFAVDKGKRYLVVVSEFVKKPARKPRRRGKKKGTSAEQPAARAGPSPPYSLAVKLGQPEGAFEREPNDQPSTARKVLLGDEFSGYLGWVGDVDVWQLTLDGFSLNYALELFVDGADGVALKLDIVNPAGKTVVSRAGRKGGPVFVKNLLVPGQPPNMHYFARLSAKRSNPEQAYVLKMTSRELGADEEREPNDEAKSATELANSPEREDDLGDPAAEGIIRGHIDPGDLDYYRFTPTRTVLLDVSVRVPTSLDASVSIRTGGVSEVADDGKRGASEQLTGVRVEAGKAAYVVVKGTFSGADPERYELMWTTVPASPGSPLEPELSDFDHD